MRLDIYVKNIMNISRTEAAGLISGGFVKKDGVVIKKAAFQTEGEGITVDERGLIPYLSRGGLKLEKGLDFFEVDLKGRICLDIGASTGGFTHCMLLRDCERVYAVDVGKDQLAEELKRESRVISMEQTNILAVEGFEYAPDFAACDVSFVSLTKILKKAYELLGETGEGIFLIKPQFEAGKGNIGKKGVCKDTKIHFKVIKDIRDFAESAGFYVKGLTFSPVKGGEGNTEYLIYLSKRPWSGKISDMEIKGVIAEAQKEFKGK
ncbi:MAG: TlyA family RNA methyltransferase [Clostridiales bacterium]|nr:TlyA family RNA methyltransferase [Clostridiales bacterium]MCD8214111.1 TlyA family RNA methyltransferase [Clostridiales bacterium]